MYKLTKTPLFSKTKPPRKLPDSRALEMKAAPGTIVLSPDRKAKWEVQADGSWKRIEDQLPGEWEEVVG